MKLIEEINAKIMEQIQNRGETPEEIILYESLLRKKIWKIVGFTGLTLVLLILFITQPSILAGIGAGVALIGSIAEVLVNLKDIFEFLNAENDE